jgi:hypothetical protein
MNNLATAILRRPQAILLRLWGAVKEPVGAWVACREARRIVRRSRWRTARAGRGRRRSGQDHVLDAAGLQIADALDDLRRGSEKYDCWRISNVRCVPITRSKTGRWSRSASARSVVSTRWRKFNPERVEPEVFGLAGELLHARGLVEAEIRPSERRKETPNLIAAEAHGFLMSCFRSAPTFW